MSIVNGGGRTFLRFASLLDLYKIFVIPEEYRERLSKGYEQAITESREIRAKQQALYKMSNLQPGSQVVRTDTGEVIAEAERIIRG
jgi:CHASE3 domain sensor protein